MHHLLLIRLGVRGDVVLGAACFLVRSERAVVVELVVAAGAEIDVDGPVLERLVRARHDLVVHLVDLPDGEDEGVALLVEDVDEAGRAVADGHVVGPHVGEPVAQAEQVLDAVVQVAAAHQVLEQGSAPVGADERARGRDGQRPGRPAERQVDGPPLRGPSSGVVAGAALYHEGKEALELLACHALQAGGLAVGKQQGEVTNHAGIPDSSPMTRTWSRSLCYYNTSTSFIFISLS